MPTGDECASRELIPHPCLPRPPGLGLRARLTACADGGLRIAYVLEGELARLRLPDSTPPRRAERLWQHSCFEVFLRPDGSDAYLEFNVAPSAAWNAYAFVGRRQGARPLPEADAPMIEIQRGAERLMIGLRLRPGLLSGRGCAGLAAVLEEETGTLSYWALAHPGRQPDFHDPAGFLLDWSRP